MYVRGTFSKGDCNKVFEEGMLPWGRGSLNPGMPATDGAGLTGRGG